MRLGRLAIATFIALGVACPPPFNDERFYTNDTARVFQEVFGDLDLSDGWIDMLSPKDGNTAPNIPWPTQDDGISRIQYCFNSPNDRSTYEEPTKAGWKLWVDVIGPPSKANGHRLSFEEFPWPEGTQWPYCYNAQQGNEGPRVWNPAVPGTILSIGQSWHEIGAGESTIGFIPEARDRNPGRHYSRFDVNEISQENLISTMAHEFGHVFGFKHEHQRPDRDHYIKFNCDRVKGYEEAVAKVIADGRFTVHDLCYGFRSSWLGYLFNFPSTEFSDQLKPWESTIPGGDLVWGWPTTVGVLYDYTSIMQYHSYIGAEHAPNHDPKYMTLARWKQGEPNYQPPEVATWDNAQGILTNQYVSYADGEGVRHIYPWTRD